ncbi:hypothetical protein BLNAU_21321 [Blattamonas nauphoetae]|uniref:Uncharacterized protein n=1 Tax=Blattamonas nauphoetae TaxID=2049346 RepID=A0ABQ9WZB5_9EUKA|nr:hypothetical protein BLNAU_21321 [Blattamonas nauphoetae]
MQSRSVNSDFPLEAVRNVDPVQSDTETKPISADSNEESEIRGHEDERHRKDVFERLIVPPLTFTTALSIFLFRVTFTPFNTKIPPLFSNTPSSDDSVEPSRFTTSSLIVR